MSRTFAYARVSTVGQEPENQIMEIEAAGFGVEPHRIVSETVFGSTAVARREGFSRLLDRMEKGDVLVVTKLDRLGRDAIDVSRTVADLARAKAAGKRLDWLSALSVGQQADRKQCLLQHLPIHLGCFRVVIGRIKSLQIFFDIHT